MSEVQKGLFIALEGGEGSGKDTQIDILKKTLNPELTVFTREPGGTEIGEKIRAFLLEAGRHIEPEIELIEFLAARAILVETVIKPALLAGKMVISNRFGLSTIAYQIYGRERHHLLPLLRDLSELIVKDCRPFYILLDVDPTIGLRRVKKRNDGKTRFDAESRSFHQRVRQGYRAHYQQEGAEGFLIDASQSVEVVSQKIAHYLKQLLLS